MVGRGKNAGVMIEGQTQGIRYRIFPVNACNTRITDKSAEAVCDNRPVIPKLSKMHEVGAPELRVKRVLASAQSGHMFVGTRRWQWLAPQLVGRYREYFQVRKLLAGERKISL